MNVCVRINKVMFRPVKSGKTRKKVGLPDPGARLNGTTVCRFPGLSGPPAGGRAIGGPGGVGRRRSQPRGAVGGRGRGTSGAAQGSPRKGGCPIAFTQPCCFIQPVRPWFSGGGRRNRVLACLPSSFGVWSRISIRPRRTPLFLLPARMFIDAAGSGRLLWSSAFLSPACLAM